jgi:hypothetical protein
VFDYVGSELGSDYFLHRDWELNASALHLFSRSQAPAWERLPSGLCPDLRKGSSAEQPSLKMKGRHARPTSGVPRIGERGADGKDDLLR